MSLVSHIIPDIESALLGHCLTESEAYLEAEQFVSAADFGLGSHRLIFLAIGALLASGRPANMATLTQHLRERNELEGVNGAAFIASLTEGLVHSRGVVRDYATRIAEKARLRSLALLTYRASEEAQSGMADFDQVAADVENGLLNLRAKSLQGDSTIIGPAVPGLLDRMERERSRKGELLGLPTGLAPLDAMTRGYQPEELTVVGARSGSGKSALMCQTTAANCRLGTAVLVISLEMSRHALLRRLIAEDSAVPFPRVVDPRWATDSDMRAIEEAAARIQKWPLHIVDDSGLTIEKLSAMARLAVRRDSVKLVAVDYAQIVSAQGRDERLRVAAVSRGLTRLAKDEGVPVLAISQLARADRSNPNRRPVMSDLRESPNSRTMRT